MKKIFDLVVMENKQLNQNYSLIKLTTTDDSTRVCLSYVENTCEGNIHV